MLRLFTFFLIVSVSVTVYAQPNRYKQVVFGLYAEDLQEFEQFVIKAKKEGATHIQINAEDLPLAYWEMAPEGDPYPAWVISNPGILKTVIPEALKGYVPQETADNVLSILDERCKILRKHGLKAAFHTFEPQMLPEAVFEDHPEWRGPQVDHPTRSKTPRFAPSVDHPEVKELYKEAMKKFIKRCPEVEILVFRTNDSGAGFDWSSYLYYGTNGNTNYRHISMAERLKGFFAVLQEGAKEAGGTLSVQVYNTKEDARELARELEKNMAVDGFEGPTGSRFSADVDALLYYKRAFSPVAGIPRPLAFLEKLEQANYSNAPRLFVALSDRHNQDLYLKIYDEFWKSPTRGIIENLQFLRKIAVSEVGEENAEKLFQLWLALDEAQKACELLNVGGTIFIIGGVQQRWITRPLVPFPSELMHDEKDYYRRHIFAAGPEEEADNLLIVQAIRSYLGEGGNRFIMVAMNKAKWNISQATRLSEELGKVLSQNQKIQFELLTTRLTAFDYLINNVINVANYQLQMDQITFARKQSKENGSNLNFDLSVREKMLGIARSEIDNTTNLIKLLEAQEHSRDIVDHAKIKEAEFVRLLGPDLIDQLYKKIKIMNAHWMDYHRIFAVPNL